MSFGIIIRSTFPAFIWSQNQVHTPPFLRYDHLCIRQFRCNFEKSAFKVPFPVVLDLSGTRKYFFFFLKISQKLHGGGLSNIGKKNQNRQMSYFSPLCQLQLSISKNRPVRLVPCFVGVHHICFIEICDGIRYMHVPNSLSIHASQINSVHWSTLLQYLTKFAATKSDNF